MGYLTAGHLHLLDKRKSGDRFSRFQYEKEARVLI